MGVQVEHGLVVFSGFLSGLGGILPLYGFAQKSALVRRRGKPGHDLLMLKPWSVSYYARFEAVSAMPDEEKGLAKSMLEAIILKNQVAGAVRQLSSAPAKAAKGKKPTSKRTTHAAAR